MHYNPMGRDTLWTLKIYANKKLLHKQVVTYGWSKDDFFAIEDLARLYGQPLQ
jgi:hypothetical protein